MLLYKGGKMKINNSAKQDHIEDQFGRKHYILHVNSPGWNMNLNDDLAVTWTLPPGAIISGADMILVDDNGFDWDGNFYTPDFVTDENIVRQWGSERLTLTGTTLWRLAGGFMNSILFDDAGDPRVKIMLHYWL